MTEHLLLFRRATDWLGDFREVVQDADAPPELFCGFLLLFCKLFQGLGVFPKKIIFFEERKLSGNMNQKSTRDT